MKNIEERTKLANELAESIKQFERAIVIRDAMSDLVRKHLKKIDEQYLQEYEPIETGEIVELSKIAHTYNDVIGQVAVAFERRTKAGNAWNELVEEEKEEQ